MSQQPFHMWNYWREKVGIEDALLSYYPETLAKSQQLQVALQNIQINQVAIHSLMQEMEEQEAE